MFIKKGDTVQVISGEGRGTTGQVLKVLVKEQKVVVEGVNKVSRHTRPSQANPDGGITKIEAPIHVSNVALLDPVKKVPTKVGYKIENGVKYRVAKKSDTVIDTVIDYNKKAANAAKNN